jgi:hypothetical protein
MREARIRSTFSSDSSAVAKVRRLSRKRFELLIFVRADEVAGDLAVAGDGDRFTLRAHSVAAEIAGEFGSRDGLGRVHGSSLSPVNTQIAQNTQLS